MSIAEKVASSLDRISEEAKREMDPLERVAHIHLEELTKVVLDEYPFIRCVTPTGSNIPSHILVGTLAGHTEGKKVITDGALDNLVFIKDQRAALFSKAENGWSFRIYLLPYREGGKLRFWIHIEGGDSKGDHPGSRRFFLMKGGKITQVAKDIYENA